MRFAGSISAKVVVPTVVAVLVAGAVGVTGWSAIGGLQGRVNQMAVVQRALHNQAEYEFDVRFDELTERMNEFASTGSAGIAGSIAGLAEVSAQTSGGVAETRRAAGQLARMAADLRQLVGHFTY